MLDLVFLLPLLLLIVIEEVSRSGRLLDASYRLQQRLRCEVLDAITSCGTRRPCLGYYVALREVAIQFLRLRGDVLLKTQKFNDSLYRTETTYLLNERNARYGRIA